MPVWESPAVSHVLCSSLSVCYEVNHPRKAELPARVKGSLGFFVFSTCSEFAATRMEDAASLGWGECALLISACWGQCMAEKMHMGAAYLLWIM